MAIFYAHRFIIIIMSFCLIAHSHFLNRPLILDDEVRYRIESNGLLNNNDDRHRDYFNHYEASTFTDDDNNILLQFINNYDGGKTTKKNFRSNLNLPRYLRRID
jgi:hypothetical protein